METEQEKKENTENQENRTEQTKKENAKNNTVFIGSKPLMNYVTSAIMQLSEQTNSNIVIKARGKFISKAVDVAEVVKRKFQQKINSEQIITNTEQYHEKKDNEEKNINVSTIEINLGK